MNRTIEDIQKDIELLGIKGGYDIEQLLTPQDCRRLSYEIERLNNIIRDLEVELYAKYHEYKDSECEELYAKSQEDKAIYDYIQELKGGNKE